MPEKVIEALKTWEDTGLQAKDRKNCPYLNLVDNMEERNSRCLENIESGVQKIKLNFILLLCF